MVESHYLIAALVAQIVKKRCDMKVLSSLKSAKKRHPDCQIVKRRGRVYVICKANPRFKAVQGGTKKRT